MLRFPLTIFSPFSVHPLLSQPGSAEERKGGGSVTRARIFLAVWKWPKYIILEKLFSLKCSSLSNLKFESIPRHFYKVSFIVQNHSSACTHKPWMCLLQVVRGGSSCGKKKTFSFSEGDNVIVSPPPTPFLKCNFKAHFFPLSDCGKWREPTGRLSESMTR